MTNDESNFAYAAPYVILYFFLGLDFGVLLVSLNTNMMPFFYDLDCMTNFNFNYHVFPIVFLV